MKAAVVALVTLLMVSGDHVTVAAAGARLSVPVPLLALVLALVLVLAACAVLTRLIWRAARPCCYPCLPRSTS